MKAQNVVDFFGGDATSESAKREATAIALGCTRQGVSLWFTGGIPAARQAQIELASYGKFRTEIRPWEAGNER